MLFRPPFARLAGSRSSRSYPFPCPRRLRQSRRKQKRLTATYRGRRAPRACSVTGDPYSRSPMPRGCGGRMRVPGDMLARRDTQAATLMIAALPGNRGGTITRLFTAAWRLQRVEQRHSQTRAISLSGSGEEMHACLRYIGDALMGFEPAHREAKNAEPVVR